MTTEQTKAQPKTQPSKIHSDALFGALDKCVESAERYPTTLTVATQPVGEIAIGKDVWRVDIAIYKQPNAQAEFEERSDDKSQADG